MKVFIDTNVILENLCNRALVKDAQALLAAVDSGKLKGYINTCSFSNITYIAELQLKKVFKLSKRERIEVLKTILEELLDKLIIVPQDNNDLRAGLDDISFDDLEDSYQYQAFVKAGCDYFVTINIKDYPFDKDKRIKHLSDFVETVLCQGS